MQDSQHRSGIIIGVFVVGLLVIVMLALAGTTWAAPGAQGTVPTPPNGTSVPPPTGGGNNGAGDTGGGNNGGGNNNGGNTGGEVPPPVAPGSTGAVCAIGDNGAQCSGTNLLVVVGAGAAPAGSALTIEGSFAQPNPRPLTARTKLLESLLSVHLDRHKRVAADKHQRTRPRSYFIWRAAACVGQ